MASNQKKTKSLAVRNKKRRRSHERTYGPLGPQQKQNKQRIIQPCQKRGDKGPKAAQTDDSANRRQRNRYKRHTYAHSLHTGK